MKITATDAKEQDWDCGNLRQKKIFPAISIRRNVRTLSIHDDMQHGLTFQKASAPFEMSVLPYSAYELENAMHLDELPSVRYTWVRIAAKQMGVGGDDSWGAPVHEEYRIHADQPMKLEFIIMPLRS